MMQPKYKKSWSALASEADTEAVARELTPHFLACQTVYLYGDLGAGKTMLVRAFLRCLGHEGAVKSPTYTLVESYRLNGRPLHHFDLYRMKSPIEFEEMGGRDYWQDNALCLIEWPEMGESCLPEPEACVSIQLDRSLRNIYFEIMG